METKSIAFLALGITISTGAIAAPKNTKPNIIFFLMDDMGYGDLSIMGSQKISTPNIDALAKSGKMLTQHYTGAPVSAPARSVLMTGLHTGHTPIRGNDEDGARGDVWDLEAISKSPALEGQKPMPASTRTMAHAMQENGYKTACIGKWGLGAPGSSSEPNNMGFDFFYGYNCQRVSHSYYPTHLYKNRQREYINPVMKMGQKIAKGADPLDPKSYDKFNTGVYAPDRMFEETIQFIDDNKDQPFFLWWTTPIPHVSLQAPKEWVDHYVKIFGDEKPFAGNHYFPSRYPHATYAAMVSYVDHQIGLIIQKLKDEGIYENTIIVFTSDNGPSCEGGGDSPWFDSARPFRSQEGWGKRSLQEGGLRVPTFIAWSGHIKPGSKSDHVCGFQDWMPTFIELTGSKAKPTTDGISLKPLLTDKGKQKAHEYLYWEYPEGGTMAVRKGDWKLIVKNIRKEPKYFLYNIKDDQLETKNMAEQTPEIVAELKSIAAKAHTEPENKSFKMGLPLK